MPDTVKLKSWKQIESIIQGGNAEELDDYLDTLSPGQVARAISRLSDDTQAALVTLLEPEDAADLIEELSDVQAADIIEELPAEQAAAIVDEMESDERADLLGEMNEGDAEAILRAMDPEEAEDARKLLTYPEDTAGGIMITEYVSYPQDIRVADVLNDLREKAEEEEDYSLQYLYVESANHILVGVVPLSTLVLAPGHSQLSSIMVPNPISVLADASLEEVEQLLDRFTFVGIPVIDEEGRMLGIVLRSDAEEAFGERAERKFMQFSGIVGGEELRSMPLNTRVFGRLSWLTVNMILNIVAAMVILIFIDVIEAVTFLAVVLPVICNMSGCSGNQAVAVSIREMALGLINPRDFTRVVLQEIRVGILNGIALGILLGGVSYLFNNNNIYFGVVVGTALALSTIVAVCLGGGIPLLLRRINIDPAIAAAPIVTTIIDMCGFFFVLGFAWQAIQLGYLNNLIEPEILDKLLNTP